MIQYKNRKRYTDEHCDKDFRDNFDLKRHNNSKKHISSKVEKTTQTILSGEPSRQRKKNIYKCECCDKYFRDNYNLKVHNNSKIHMEKINKTKPYQSNSLNNPL